jgi:uncharacterized protein
VDQRPVRILEIRDATPIRTDPREASPLSSAERVAELDVLRGIALFGVFLMNFVPFAGAGVMATEEQLLSLPTAGFDFALRSVLEWLVQDKANSIFAFLFGLGFYLQMTRLEARGADFERIYRRRLFVLLIIGAIHNTFFWAWDILHLYALAGFLLLAFRQASDRTLVVAGLLLAVFGRTALKTMLEFSVGDGGGDGFALYSDEAALIRQGLSEGGSYFGLAAHFLDVTMSDYVLTGFITGWLFYALGRFFLGAWVGRYGWIQNSAQFAPQWRRLMRWALPVGLCSEGAAVMLMDAGWLPEFAHRELVGWAVHLLAAPVLAAGYVAAIIVALQGRVIRRLLAPFAYAGRMALTNYLTQSAVYALVLFGVGPGLALAGRIGTCAVFGITVGVYALQILASRWWLGRFEYGPVEWVWRALTYGTLPAMKKGSDPIS